MGYHMGFRCFKWDLYIGILMRSIKVINYTENSSGDIRFQPPNVGKKNIVVHGIIIGL